MIQYLSILSGISLLIAIFILIYQNRLKKEYSILWLLLSIAILFFSFWREGLDKMAAMMGVYYAPALLFMIAFMIVLLLLIHLSVVVSKQKDQIKILSQKMALLEERLTK